MTTDTQYDRSVAVHGIPLGGATERLIAAGRPAFPIRLCLCVWDNPPESPCPCTGPIAWLPVADITARTETDRRSVKGEAITRFFLKPEALTAISTAVAFPVGELAERMPGEEPQPGPVVKAVNPGWITAGIAVAYLVKDVVVALDEEGVFDDPFEGPLGVPLFEDIPRPSGDDG